MTQSPASSAPDIASAETFARLQKALGSDMGGRTVYVDFDHTLLLANSTEEFVRAARPYSLYAIVLGVLSFLKPWNLMSKDGAFVWRDVIRTVAILVLAPWTLLFFPRQARNIFQQKRNRALDHILENIPVERLIILSFGYRPVIKAMLRGTRYEKARIVSPGWFNAARLRRGGKLEMLAQAGLTLDPKRDILITDNARDDEDILAVLDEGYHIEWSEAETALATTPPYVPFFYTAKIKRTPGFFIKQVVLEELPIVLLAYGLFGWALNLSVWISLGLLFAAIILVYEIGYAQNDKVGLATEEKPKLSEAFFKYQNYRLEPQAWIWALILSAIAILFLGRLGTQMSLSRLGLEHLGSGLAGKAALFGIWTGILVLSRLAFWVFNKATLGWRVFAYLPLHLSKYLGFLALFPISAIGLALLYAHIVRTWAMYAVRRAGGDPEYLPSQFTRFVFLLMLIGTIMLIAPQTNILGQWQTWLIVVFCAVRAVPEIRRKLFSV